MAQPEDFRKQVLTLGIGYATPFQSWQSKYLIFLRINLLKAKTLKRRIRSSDFYSGHITAESSCRHEFEFIDRSEPTRAVLALVYEGCQIPELAHLSKRWLPPAISLECGFTHPFRVCPQCIQFGFHTPIHQLPWISVCPFHLDTKLTLSCPNCSKSLICSPNRMPKLCSCCDYTSETIDEPERHITSFKGGEILIRRYLGLVKKMQDFVYFPITKEALHMASGGNELASAVEKPAAQFFTVKEIGDYLSVMCEEFGVTDVRVLLGDRQEPRIEKCSFPMIVQNGKRQTKAQLIKNIEAERNLHRQKEIPPWYKTEVDNIALVLSSCIFEEHKKQLQLLVAGASRQRYLDQLEDPILASLRQMAASLLNEEQIWQPRLVILQAVDGNTPPRPISNFVYSSQDALLLPDPMVRTIFQHDLLAYVYGLLCVENFYLKHASAPDALKAINVERYLQAYTLFDRLLKRFCPRVVVSFRSNDDAATLIIWNPIGLRELLKPENWEECPQDSWAPLMAARRTVSRRV